MPKVKLISPNDRLGMSRFEAAEYIGVSPPLFDAMVQDGRMPQPKLINRRHVWLRARIERAFEQLPDAANDVVADDPYQDCA